MLVELLCIGDVSNELGDRERPPPFGCGLFELRAAKSKFCCCGVKKKFGGSEPPVPAPVEAIARSLMRLSYGNEWAFPVDAEE